MTTPFKNRGLFRLLATSSPSSSTTTITNNNELEWETFEFSRKPKSDARFFQQNADDEDKQQSQNNSNPSINKQQLWQSLSLTQVQNSIATLLPYVRPARVERIQSVLAKRTQNVRFLFENPANPSNVFACLRTLDSFGIQYADVFLQPSLYQGTMALSQKKGVKTAMGSAQWMTLQQYIIQQDATLTSTLEKYKQQHNCRIYASCLSPDAKDIREIVWPSDQTICIVMGNEERGITTEMRHAADELFTLPMVGFAESFNLSVATAIACAHLSTQPNLLRPNLSEHQQQLLLLQGLIHSIPQKRMSKALLKQAGIELPHDLLG
ncbi:tRNA (guanosine-2'-O-)-methyltransferase [Fistulifera solaris]|uniref:tRNA (Guanosine-2'-O-)-methyltransferase n=1 Tax=Fistulifera solaris TaxID=1519565 RepID=A0A1Z5JBJ6_FISSO|nr:tRNA (guanosine-2'-O-)-methyltransferase [Fistulifera solaris]|eukprot:GAX11272.1 tRNA (guanosine-2'-O-)-methyltransferase [Fistulifera solaris]